MRMFSPIILLNTRIRSFRINNGMILDMDTESQEFANRERRVADGTFPPSSTGHIEDGGTQQTQGERYPLSDGYKPMNNGGGGGDPAGANRPPVRGAPTPGDGDYS